MMTVGGIPSAAISIEAALDEGAAIASSTVAGVTTAAANLATASGMAGVIGGSLAEEAAIVNGVVVGGMVGDIAEGDTAAALRWVVYWGLLEARRDRQLSRHSCGIALRNFCNHPNLRRMTVDGEHPRRPVPVDVDGTLTFHVTPI
jgi:hypothetical protein